MEKIRRPTPAASLVPAGRAPATGGVVSPLTTADKAALLRANEENAQRSRSRHRALVDNAAECILFFDAIGAITYCSPAIAGLLGYRPGRMLGRKWTEFVHPEDDKIVSQRFAASRERPGIGMDARTRVRHEDGTWRLVQGAITNLLSDPHVGAIVYHFRLAGDADDDRDEWQRIFESSPDMTVVVDFDGSFRRANPAFERMLGLSLEEIQARPSLQFLHSDDRAMARVAMRHLRAGRQIAGGENRWRSKDGSFRTLQWRARAILPERRIYATAHDVTQEKAALEELRRSEVLFRTLADAMPQIVWTADAEGRIDYVNKLWVEYTGIDIDHSLGVDALAGVHQADAPRFTAMWAQAQRNGEPCEMEFRLTRARDGAHRWHQARGVPVRDAAGKIIRWLGTATDIDDHKRIEDQLAEAQRIAHFGGWSYDVALDKMTWSAELYRIFGLDPEASKITYSKVAILLQPDDAFDESTTGAASVLPVGPYEKYVEIERPDEVTRVCHVRAVVEADDDAIVKRVYGTVQDVTELHEKEAEIKKQAELLNLTHDAIIMWDLNHAIRFWSKGAERLLRWTSAEAIEQLSAPRLCDDAFRFDMAMEHLLEKGEWNGELQLRTKSEGRVYVDCRWTLVRDETEAPRSVLAINTDITEQKKLEAQFLRAQRLDSIGTLASGVAHDLNNILAPILMAVPILRGSIAPEVHESLVAIIETSAQRGADIVKQVLTFARGVEGNRILIQPRHLLKEVASIAEETFPKSIIVATEYSEDLSTIEGDPTHLHQVLLNLAVNARDAMPQGGTLKFTAENFEVDEQYASMMPEAATGPHVLIQVSDTGCGMTREVTDKIFDPFFTTKSLGKGTGLGLSTTLGLVKGHGGFITVASEVGRGSTFKVFFPAKAGEAPDAGKIECIEPRRGEGELVLLVDDEPNLLQVAKTILEAHGYCAITAGDGTEAIATFAIRSKEIRVVLTDLMMPLMDGVTLIHTLRRMKPDIQIIASTGGSGSEARMGNLEELNLPAFLAKPYTRDRLLAAFDAVLHPLDSE